MTAIPSIPVYDIGRSKSALCLNIATTVAAIENVAKTMATMPVVREKASKPGKERNVTDALNIMAALRQGRFALVRGKLKMVAYHKTGAGPNNQCGCSNIAKTTFFVYPGREPGTFKEYVGYA